MSAVRELIRALRRRGGVEAAIVVGRDGLVIDADAEDGIDAERVAAHVPSLVAAGGTLGGACSRGELAMGVLEHERGGLTLVSVLSPDVVLLVLLGPSADVAPLLHELRHERARLAALV